MVIHILDHTPQCYTSQDGELIFNLLKPLLDRGNEVTISFSGVTDVPSSFVNASLIPFVQERGANWLKARVRITGATKQVADMIRRCIANADRQLVH